MSREISDITLIDAPTSTTVSTLTLIRNSTTGAVEGRELSSIPNATGSGVFTSRWTRNASESSMPPLDPGDPITGGWPDASNGQDTYYTLNATTGVGVNFTALVQNRNASPLVFQICEVDIATPALGSTALYTSSSLPANSLAYYTFTVTPTSTGLQTWMFIAPTPAGSNDIKLWALS